MLDPQECTRNGGRAFPYIEALFQGAGRRNPDFYRAILQHGIQLDRPYAWQSILSKTPLVVIVGAGFSQALDIAGTSELTELSRSIRLPQINLGPRTASMGVPLADLIWKALSAYYDRPNFETMIHGIEALLAYQIGMPGAQIADAVKSINNAFMDVTPRWSKLAESHDLRSLASEILTRVATRVAQGANRATAAPQFPQAKAFIDRLTSDFDVTFVNLNYDDALDNLLPDSVDGYSDGDGVLFDWNMLRAYDSRPRNLHVHGSIKFGVKSGGANRPATIVKYSNPANAQNGWSFALDVIAQSGEPVLVGPIITGLRKADKTLWAPYGHYLHYFIEQLFRSPRILSVGYGGADNHINQWIAQWLSHHGSSARYVAITLFDNIDDLADDAQVFRVPSTVMNLQSLHDFKLVARSRPDNYRNRIMTMNGAMVDGNGIPDSQRLDAIVSFLHNGLQSGAS